MSDHQDEQGDERQEPTQEQDGNGPALSESGSGALNAETSQGGADSVPDTPDVNTEISDRVETREQGDDR
jgi:hypothetical protein